MSRHDGLPHESQFQDLWTFWGQVDLGDKSFQHPARIDTELRCLDEATYETEPVSRKHLAMNPSLQRHLRIKA